MLNAFATDGNQIASGVPIRFRSDDDQRYLTYI
jgi:hypothetical protein